MNVKLLAGLVIFLAVFVGLAFWATALFREDFEQNRARRGSAAVAIKGTLRQCDDNYFGYVIEHTIEFRNRLQDRGYGIEFVSDGKEIDYDVRNRAFRDGKCDVMMIPIITYVFHGRNYGFPGVIPVVGTESFGADAVLAYKEDLIGSENRDVTVNDLNNPSLRICVTPKSPSSFLLDTGISNFALSALRGNSSWKIETNGSTDALERFKNKQCNVAVLWEPDVSKGLELAGVVEVYGSDEIAGMIIDVPVVHKNLLGDQEKLDAYFATHFETLQFYSNPKNEKLMIDHFKRVSDFKSEDALRKALKRIKWYDLQDNCNEWFAVTSNKRDRIREAIDLMIDVSIDVGELPEDPLHGDYLPIINKDVLKRFCTGNYVQGSIGADVLLGHMFTALTPEQWETLQPVGEIDLASITFRPGTAEITLVGQEDAQKNAAKLHVNFGAFRVVVEGHTSQAFTQEAKARNLQLSQERAEAVRNHFIENYGVHPDRIRAIGKGDTELPPRGNMGELQYRNVSERVEVNLYKDVPQRLGGG